MEKNLQYIIFLLIILAIAAFFRLWQLNSIPPGLYPDVAMNGNDALESSKTGNFKLFYPENNGREGLMIWLIAFSFSIFGVSVWSIKIVAALIGILTVLGLYLLIKELLTLATSDKRQATSIALLSSFFLAISFWHVNFSRIGFRAILVPFGLVFLFYFLFQGFRTKKVSNFIFSGLFFGLGFYTYIAFRLTPLLVLLILIPWWLIYKKENQRKKFWLFAICFLLFAILVALPIGIYFLNHPQNFISRTGDVSVFSQDYNPPFSQILALGKSLASHLSMFNFYGDQNWRHNFAGSPMLSWPIGILFLIGVFISLKELISSIKNKNLSLVTCHLSLLCWFFVMLLPGILTYEGIPHALRTIGVIPVVYIFAGLGGWRVYEKFKQKLMNFVHLRPSLSLGYTKSQKLLLVACCLFLVVISFSEFDKYFKKWGQNPEVKNAFSTDYVEIGNYLNSLSSKTQKYVIVNQPGVPVPYPNGIPMPAQTIMFIERTKFKEPQAIYLLPENINQLEIKKEEGVVVLMRYDENLFNELLKRFPKGEVSQKNEIQIFKISP